MKTIQEIDQNKFRVPISELHLWDDNYKEITREKIDQLKLELLEEGQLNALLVDARKGTQGRVIGGNASLIAIGELIVEEKWPYGDMVWVEPVEPKSEAHAIKLAYLHNSQYGKVDKQKVAEHAMILDAEGFSLRDIPVAVEGRDYSVLDVLDEFRPSDPDPTQEVKEPKNKEVECPNCSHIFKI